MKKLILLLLLFVPLISFGQNQIMSEDDIADMALKLSKSTSNRNISNNDIKKLRDIERYYTTQIEALPESFVTDN